MTSTTATGTAGDSRRWASPATVLFIMVLQQETGCSPTHNDDVLYTDWRMFCSYYRHVRRSGQGIHQVPEDGVNVCEEKSWRPHAAAFSDFQYVSHRPLWWRLARGVIPLDFDASVLIAGT